VKVSFYATLRRSVGSKTVDVPLADGASVRDLVDAIIDQHPDLGPLLLDEAGLPRRGVHVFVNGRGAGYLARGFDTPLAASDTVDVFPAVAGG